MLLQCESKSSCDSFAYFFYFLFRPKSFAYPTLFRFVFDLWFQKFITKWVSWWSKRFDFICVQRHNVPVPWMDITKLNRQMSIIRHAMSVEYVDYSVVQQRDAQFWIYPTVPSNHQSGKTTQTSIYACIRMLPFISCVTHTYFLLGIETEWKKGNKWNFMVEIIIAVWILNLFEPSATTLHRIIKPIYL